MNRREEVLLLARHAGLDLPPEYLDELVEVYGFVAAMIARLPSALPHQAEPAHVFVARRFQPPPP